MAYFMEVPLDDGSAVLVEVTDQVEGVVSVGGRGEVIGRLGETFEQSLGRMRRLAGRAAAQLRTDPHPPDRVTVELGIKVTAKSGLVVAESAAEGHLTVTFEWCREPHGAPGDGR